MYFLILVWTWLNFLVISKYFIIYLRIIIINFYFILFFLASWRGVESRKIFFESYAKVHGFDPLIPENWYSQHTKSILSTKVCLF